MKKILLAAICVVAIVAAGVWIYRNQSGGPQSFDVSPYCLLGTGVAEETAKLITAKGAVLLFVPDTTQNPNATIEEQLKCCEHTLKQKGLPPASTVRFKLTMEEKMATGGAVPGKQLLSAIQSQPKLAAVILLCAFPALTTEECEVLKRSGAKIVVSSGYFPAYRKLLEAQVLHAAIVPRFDRGYGNAEKPKTVRESFDAQFTVVTSANVTTLPY